MAEKKSKVNWTMVALVAVLVLAVGYIGVSEYTAWKQDQDMQLYRQGLQDATDQIAEKTAQCQTISVTTESNKTVTLASMECVQKQLQGQQMQQPPAQQGTSGNGSQQLLNA